MQNSNMKNRLELRTVFFAVGLLLLMLTSALAELDLIKLIAVELNEENENARFFFPIECNINT